MNYLKNYFKILKIEKNASNDEIKKAYLKMAKKYHPDKNDNSIESIQMFQEIFEAFEVLTTRKDDYLKNSLHFIETTSLDIVTVLKMPNLSIEYDVYKPCKKCDQSGFDTNSLKVKCHICEGEGEDRFGKNCKKCNGTGDIYNKRCLICQGKKIIKTKQLFKIEKPYHKDIVLRFKKMGHWSEDGTKIGFLIVQVIKQ